MTTTDKGTTERDTLGSAHQETPPRSLIRTVAVIGPSNPVRISGATGIPEALYMRAAYRAGAILAVEGCRMVVVPDRGVAIDAMDGYLDAGGTDLVGLTPSSGACEPAARESIRVNRDRCHTIVDDLSWYEQHHRIGAMSDAMICIGLSSGTLVEIAWTKWNPGPAVALVEGTIGALPVELAAEIDSHSISLDELRSWLVAQPTKERRVESA